MAGAPAGPAPARRLEHWIYGSVPEVGYSVRAQSTGLNLSLYARRLDGIYTPVAGENLHGEDSLVDVVMIQPTGGGTDLLYSLVRPGPPDEEFQRRTFLNHTAVVPVGALRSGSLCFDDIDAALRSFDLGHPGAIGPLDPLPIEADAPGGDAHGVGRYVSQPSAETLLTRTFQDPENRTLVLCRNSDPVTRRRTAVRLVELLSLRCGLPFPATLSDTPGLPVANRFQLVVSARAFRTDGSWALLDNGLDAPTMPRVKDQDSAYAALEAAFAHGPDTP